MSSSTVGERRPARELLGWLALALCTAGALALAWKLKQPCLDVRKWNGRHEYAALCYSDLIPFWNARGLAHHLWLYVQHPFEYPVLAGAAVQWASAGVSSLDAYFVRMCILLGLVTAISVWAVAELIGGVRPRAYFYVLSPPIVLFVFHNFEQLAALGLLLGLVALLRGRLTWAGVFFGLGAAVKLFPGAAGVGVAAALVGQGRIREALRVGLATLVTFVAVNLPVVIVNPAGWWATYAFHAHRTADWGTLQYLISSDFKISLRALTSVGDVGGALGLVALFAGIALIARRRPFSLETAAATGVIALLWVNKVGSPQFALWVWPLLLVLDIDLGWSLLFAFATTLHLLGIFGWFAAGLAPASSWRTAFQVGVLVRWLELGALVAWLMYRRPTVLARAEPARLPIRAAAG